METSATQSQDQVKDGTPFDIVLSRGAVVSELFSPEDQPLLLRWNPFLLFDSFLDSLYLIVWLNVQFDLFACQSLYLDKHCLGSDLSKINESGKADPLPFRALHHPLYLQSAGCP
jgi:hypothetical protein